MQLIYSRNVDKSTLWDGFTIRSSLIIDVLRVTGQIAVGEKREIKFLMNGKLYEGIQFKNQNFNRQKYPDHIEMYQVRYSPRSEFATDLRAIYADLWDYIELQRQAFAAAGVRKNVTLPPQMQRQIAFFASEVPDVWVVETFSAADYQELDKSLQRAGLSEYDLEAMLQRDETARVVTAEKRVNLRVLDRKVGENLKRLYSYRCQICGKDIAAPYGEAHIVDAHHIDPFSTSKNNNFDNIMVLCPSHHRIIHACHGRYRRQLHEIWYPNGLHEPLQLNLHL